MNHDYRDIRDRIPDPPKWWDEHAVPRYCDFGPDEVANIYAGEVCLLQIACQECGTLYEVAMSSSNMDIVMGGMQLSDAVRLSETSDLRAVHYGDPPRGCPGRCSAGATMNSVPIKVLEFWRKQTPREGFGWERVSDLEIDVTPEWAEDIAWPVNDS